MRERICRMICSTSTASERTEKSDMTCLFQGLPAIAAASVTHTLGQELGGLRDAGAQDAERPDERLAPGQLDFCAFVADLRVTVRVWRQRLPVAEQAAPGARGGGPPSSVRL